VGLLPRLFVDSRESRLEQQVWAPLLAANEMGNPSIGFVLEKITGLKDYAGQFEAAFDGKPASMETLGAALAAYERSLIAGDSPFDRWRAGRPEPDFSPAAERGFALFSGKAACSSCHTLSASDALFTDHGLHNTGVGFAQSMHTPAHTARVTLAPGTKVPVLARDRAVDRIDDARAISLHDAARSAIGPREQRQAQPSLHLRRCVARVAREDAFGGRETVGAQRRHLRAHLGGNAIVRSKNELHRVAFCADRHRSVLHARVRRLEQERCGLHRERDVIGLSLARLERGLRLRIDFGELSRRGVSNRDVERRKRRRRIQRASGGHRGRGKREEKRDSVARARVRSMHRVHRISSTPVLPLLKVSTSAL
jgi:hypothetical protein